MDDSPTSMVVYVAVFTLLGVGALRTILYAYGMALTQHWYDAPFRWCVKLVVG
jgi:hypothetical protein